VLSGNDPIVDALGIKATVKDSTECWMYENHMHGDVVVRPAFHKRLKKWVDAQVSKFEVEESSFMLGKGNLRRASASCSQLA
jgi:hypothetical protein